MSKKEEVSQAAEKVAKAKKEKSAKANKSGKPNIFVRMGKGIARFCKDFKGETKKIVWPGLKEIVRSTGVVLLAVLIIGACIWVVDFGLSQLLELIMKVAENKGSAETATTAQSAFIALRNLFY